MKTEPVASFFQTPTTEPVGASAEEPLAIRAMHRPESQAISSCGRLISVYSVGWVGGIGVKGARRAFSEYL